MVTLFRKRQGHKEDTFLRAQFLVSETVPFLYVNPLLETEFCSQALKDLLGVEDDFTLHSLRQFFRPRNAGKMAFALQELQDKDKTEVFTLQHPHNDMRIICYGARRLDAYKRIDALVFFYEAYDEESETIEELEHKLRRNQDEFASVLEILNAAPYPIWMRNKLRKITYINKRYMDILGTKLQHIEQDKNLELFTELNDLTERTLSENEPQTTRSHQVINGKRYLFKITETPMQNGRIMGFARDITEQENIEIQLKQQIRVQSNFLKQSSIATAIYDGQQRLTFYNDAFAQLWGLNGDWLNNHPFYNEVLDELRKQRKLPEQTDFKRFREKQQEYFSQLIKPANDFFYLPDGRVVKVNILPQEAQGLIFSYEDISDKISLEQSYNTQLAVKRTTIDSLQEAVGVFGEDGRLQLYNISFADLWHFTPQELDKMPHSNEVFKTIQYLFKSEEENEEFEKILIKFSSNREHASGKLFRVDNSVLQWSIIPLPDGATMMTFLDITDSYLVEKSLRAEKEALREADMLKSNFLANVSYELRSPLTTIRGFSEIMEKEYFGKLNKKQKEYIHGILASSLTLSQLINDVLDMASIDAGYMSLALRQFSLDEVLKTIAEEFNDHYRDLPWEYTLSPDIGPIKADQHRISQIIYNLLRHSAATCVKNTKILLHVANYSEKQFSISVIYTPAEGMAPDQSSLFEHFYQIRKDAQTPYSLALPVVKSFVELHGGIIDIEHNEGERTASIICYMDKITDIPALIEAKFNA